MSLVNSAAPLRGTAFASPATLARLGSGGAVTYGANGSQRTRLPDGRLHLNHGPMDLILQLWGEGGAVARAECRALARFDQILQELCAELPELRRWGGRPTGPIARVMAQAVAPFEAAFITPMAAVAGAVAEDILRQIALPGIERAYVNNGGDIAVHLSPGSRMRCAIAGVAGASGRIRLDAESPVRGIATSGWGGRSFSLGIADAVTVLARTASMADAAATVIANAVDLPDHCAITRRPACDLHPDSDLGHRLVTVGVGALTEAERQTALGKGLVLAESLRQRGLIEGAALALQGTVQISGHMALHKEEQRDEQVRGPQDRHPD